MKLTKKEIADMMKMAKKTRKFAFAHRSLHNIGASVLTTDGKIYGGCNVESVISGLGTCAERCAIDNAIAHGSYKIKAVCTLDQGFTPSCGACLQYTLLFSQVSGKDVIMLNADADGNYEIDMLSELIPEGYRTQNNLEVIRSYGKGKKGHIIRKKIKEKRSKKPKK